MSDSSDVEEIRWLEESRAEAIPDGFIIVNDMEVRIALGKAGVELRRIKTKRPAPDCMRCGTETHVDRPFGGRTELCSFCTTGELIAEVCAPQLEESIARYLVRNDVRQREVREATMHTMLARLVLDRSLREAGLGVMAVTRAAEFSKLDALPLRMNSDVETIAVDRAVQHLATECGLRYSRAVFGAGP